jgi:hypothetical protein
MDNSGASFGPNSIHIPDNIGVYFAKTAAKYQTTFGTGGCNDSPHVRVRNE